MTARARKPRVRDAEATQARLIAAAKHLFARHGLHGTSVTDIAKRAKVSVAMINHHFGGKEGLYRACLAGFGAARLAALDRFLVAPRTAEELAIRLEVLIHELLALHLAELDMVTILLRDANAAEHWGPDVEQLVYAFTLKLARFFELARDAGLLRAGVDPLTPASVLYLALSGLLIVDVNQRRVPGASLREPAQRASIVQRLLDLVLHGAAR